VVRGSEFVTLQVRDDGCGIAEGRMRQALLEGHVGLAAVRERVAALNGTLDITTAAGAGTTVRVTLPCAPREWPSAARGAPGEVSDRVTRHDTLRVSTG
jgi:nitrate/nitrite-specific signal transduction histidine kinase